MNKHLSQFDTIRIGAQETIAAERAISLPCPFCNENPPLASLISDKFVVGCENEDCAANPQVSDSDLSRVWEKWNSRTKSF